jgi:hypothetical protein
MIKTRKLNENDSFLIEKLINLDPEHAGKSKVGFWLPQDRTNCFVVEDEVGTVFYVRAENVLRLHVQFDVTEPERTKKALDEFAKHIRETAKPNYRQIIFESTFAPLIRFLEKRGYRASKDEYVADL